MARKRRLTRLPAGINPDRLITDLGAPKKRSKGKYRVDNTDAGKLARTLDGILFPSVSEKNRYAVLKQNERAGIITGLELHPKFEIIPAFEHNGKKYRRTVYTADFRYFLDGQEVIEEVKGSKKIDSRDFVIRKKLFLLQHPELVYFVIRPPYIKAWPPQEEK